MSPLPYLERRRHVLLDMHIPDWDERFLSRYDPAGYVELCASAGADAVMVYCNSHVGPAYWPTKVGPVHRNVAGRDLVGETVELLHERDIAVCAYYSAIFNNWAYTEHPEWRLVASASGGAFGPGSRYGECCPANPEYLDFMLAQTEELATAYPFDAFFFDMVFWPDVCVCESCRSRWGGDLPERVDWRDPEWCRFQGARQSWLADAFRQLRARVKQTLPVPVFLNSDLLSFNWVGGASAEICALNDLLGGDYEARALFELSAAIAPVVQYMVPISGYGGGVSDLASTEMQQRHALAAVAYGAQFMAIDAVEPEGRVNPGTYERLREVFDAMRPYDECVGGQPLAEIGVYCSIASRVSLEHDGAALAELPPGAPFAPPGEHWSAAQGALRALNEAHLPCVAVTQSELEGLPLLVFPEVTRLDEEEVAAIRAYVAAGGRLYASGRTSLLTTDGVQQDDFLLADVFGCRFRGEPAEAVTYLRPVSADLSGFLAPLEYVPVGEPSHLEQALRSAAAPRQVEIEAGANADVLMTVTVPYAGGRGTRDDQGWSSIHSAPPWEDTARPAIVRHRYGDGDVIYSAVDLTGASGRLAGTSRRLFVELIRTLLGRPPAFEADAHPHAWTTVFHEPEASRFRLAFLNSPPDPDVPALPLPAIRFRLAAPAGATFTALRRVPGGEELPFGLDADGALHAELPRLEQFEMLHAEHT